MEAGFRVARQRRRTRTGHHRGNRVGGVRVQDRQGRLALPRSQAEEDGDTAGRYYRIYGVSTGDYLRWLAGQGYTLSEVEQVVTGERLTAEVYDSYLAATSTPTSEDEEG